MTRQEQIDEMTKFIQIEYEQWLDTTGVIPKATTYYAECLGCAIDSAEALYNEGYRKVPFGATVLTPEERDDEMKATNEILAERDDLIAKVGVLGRENYDLKAENRQLKTECALLDDELRIARQDIIDVLNKLKTQTHNYYPSIDSYCVSQHVVLVNDIDKLLEEYEK